MVDGTSVYFMYEFQSNASILFMSCHTSDEF